MKINTAQSISSPIELQSLKTAFFTLMELLNCKRGNKLEQNHSAFFERERGRGGKGKLFFP